MKATAQKRRGFAVGLTADQIIDKALREMRCPHCGDTLAQHGVDGEVAHCRPRTTSAPPQAGGKGEP